MDRIREVCKILLDVNEINSGLTEHVYWVYLQSKLVLHGENLLTAARVFWSDPWSKNTIAINMLYYVINLLPVIIIFGFWFVRMEIKLARSETNISWIRSEIQECLNFPENGTT